MGNRRGDIGDLVGDPVIAPELLSSLGIHAHQAATGELDVLLHPRSMRNHNRRIAGSVESLIAFEFQGAPPELLASHFVEGGDSRIGPTGRAHHLIAIHQWRLRIPPTERQGNVSAAVHHLSAEVLTKIFAPYDVARFGLQTGQAPERIDHIDPIAVHRWGAAGAGKASPEIAPFERRADFGPPAFLPAARVERDDKNLVVHLPHRED